MSQEARKDLVIALGIGTIFGVAYLGFFLIVALI